MDLIAYFLPVICLWNPILATKVKLIASTSVVHPLLTPSLTLRCVIEDTSPSSSLVGRRTTNGNRRGVSSTPGNAKFVLSMFMFRNSEDIASVSEHVAAMPVSKARNIKVSGGIQSNGTEKGVLEVEIDYPTDNQTGSYECKVTAIDDVGHSVEYSDSVDIDVSMPTMTDILHHIQSQDQNNRDEITTLKAELTNLKAEDGKNKAEIVSLKAALNVSSHIESGVVNGGYVGSSYSMSRTQIVKFKRPYWSTPTVHLALLDAGIRKDYQAYLHVKLVNADNKGFTVPWSTDNAGHFLQYVTISWVSFPQL